MSPNEKAKEIVFKMWDNTPNRNFNTTKDLNEDNYSGINDSISCAITAVELIRSEYSGYRVKHYLTLEHALELRKYWDDVLDCLNTL